MEHGILLSGADNIDFMIHGVFKYSFFGHEVWITTTHVCVLIVMLLIIGFAIAATRQMARSAGRLSECGGADRGEAGCHGGCSHGQGRTEVLQLHRNDLHLHSGEQYFRSVRPASPHSGLRRDIASRCSDLPADPLQSVQVPEAERNLGRHVFPAAALAADLAAH